MEFALVALAGVIVGAAIAMVISSSVYRRRGDRDIVERRLRACAEYRECLGDLDRELRRAPGDPAVLAQAWRQMDAFCREYRISHWLFDERIRRELGAIVAEVERERERSANDADANVGRLSQVLCELYCRLDRVLRREADRQARAFVRYGAFSAPGDDSVETGDPLDASPLDERARRANVEPPSVAAAEPVN